MQSQDSMPPASNFMSTVVIIAHLRDLRHWVQKILLTSNEVLKGPAPEEDLPEGQGLGRLGLLVQEHGLCNARAAA